MRTKETLHEPMHSFAGCARARETTGMVAWPLQHTHHRWMKKRKTNNVCQYILCAMFGPEKKKKRNTHSRTQWANAYRGEWVNGGTCLQRRFGHVVRNFKQHKHMRAQKYGIYLFVSVCSVVHWNFWIIFFFIHFIRRDRHINTCICCTFQTEWNIYCSAKWISLEQFIIDFTFFFFVCLSFWPLHFVIVSLSRIFFLPPSKPNRRRSPLNLRQYRKNRDNTITMAVQLDGHNSLLGSHQLKVPAKVRIVHMWTRCSIAVVPFRFACFDVHTCAAQKKWQYFPSARSTMVARNSVMKYSDQRCLIKTTDITWFIDVFSLKQNLVKMEKRAWKEKKWIVQSWIKGFLCTRANQGRSRSHEKWINAPSIPISRVHWRRISTEHGVHGGCNMAKRILCRIVEHAFEWSPYAAHCYASLSRLVETPNPV